MIKEWRKTATVLPGGRLELDFPELAEGDTVEVSVRATADSAPVPCGSILDFGRYRGRIWMAPDFDAPLEDFREYI